MLASIVAGELYGRGFPVLTVEPEDFEKFENGQWVTISADGIIEISPGPQTDSFS